MKNIKVRYLRQMVTKPDKKKIFIKGIIVCLVLYGIFALISFLYICDEYKNVIRQSGSNIASEEKNIIDAYTKNLIEMGQNVDDFEIIKAANYENIDDAVNINNYLFSYHIVGYLMSDLEKKDIFIHQIYNENDDRVIAIKMKGGDRFKEQRDGEGVPTNFDISEYSNDEIITRYFKVNDKEYNLFLVYDNNIFKDLGKTIIPIYLLILLAMMMVAILFCNRKYYKRKASYEIFTYRNDVINEISKGTAQQLNEIKENALLVMNTDDEDVVREKTGEMMQSVEDVNTQIIDALKKGKKYE